MSQWYRDALGGIPPTRGNDEARVELSVEPDVPLQWWSLSQQWHWGIRATCQHPDAVARIGTRLGIIAVALAIMALVPTLVDLAHHDKDASYQQRFLQVFLLSTLITGVAAIFLCRGASRAEPT